MQSPVREMLLPCLGMVVVTMVVWIRLYFERTGEMKARRVSPQSIATRQEAARILLNTRAADNFSNLFEMPVLFYVLCLALATSGLQSSLFVMGAWTYVILRAIHSLIHVTYNHVIHRFAIYVISSVLLFGMWLGFGLRLVLS
ncbi:MAG TPA: MAPEG family protein [Rhodocyclaceae bacterium]|nr:MAPEG family protein [Rhodocyclaceae bacterium]